MGSGRVVAFRQSARVGVIASVLAGVALMVSPSAAFAVDTSIGSAVAGTGVCSSGLDTVQLSAAAAPGYAVPANGFITAWSTQAVATLVSGPLGPVGLEVWHPTGTALTYSLVGASPLVSILPPATPTFTLATPIAVVAGDLIGLRLEGPMTCSLFTSNPADSYGYSSLPAVNGVQVFSAGSGATLNVQATVSTTAPGGGGGGGGTGCDSTGTSTGDDACESESNCDSAASTNPDCAGHDSADKQPAADAADAAKHTDS
jgi:hypothetical protein